MKTFFYCSLDMSQLNVHHSSKFEVSQNDETIYDYEHFSQKPVIKFQHGPNKLLDQLSQTQTIIENDLTIIILMFAILKPFYILSFSDFNGSLNADM